LIKVLIENEIEVIAVVRPGSDRNHRLSQFHQLMIIEADISNLDMITKEKTGKVDWFFHLAWEGTSGSNRDNADLQIKNIQYTLDAVRLAEKIGCRRFIGAGSQAECGRTVQKISSNSIANPDTSYGAAKLCAGQLSRLVCGKIGIEHIWTRILSIYGPYDAENTMITSSIRNMLKGIDTSYSKAEQLWDYLYSEDAAKAIFLCAKKGISNKIYPIASGKAIPLKEYIIKMYEEAGGRGRLGIGDIPYSNIQIMYLCGDIRELSADTGFRPETDFKTGIKKTIMWCKQMEF
ncbi:MAG: NAD(P)-dependent oxidoreductase, partial [Herbinix sp.]|nr:NAD(P)-dependent oxidoreductase [Herbinix sp.]